MGGTAAADGQDCDVSFKILLVGNSGVGKTCLLTRFQKNAFEEETISTIGVDFAIKKMWVNDLLVRLAIWDTAGQERFRTLTSTYYRGAKGVIFVYDVTNRETLEAITEFWLPEVQHYCTNGEEPVKMLVANKVDMCSDMLRQGRCRDGSPKAEEREVSWEAGSSFAQQHGCLFVETSAKANVAVTVAFEELVLKVLESPSLMPSLHDQRDVVDLLAKPSQQSYCC